MFAADKRHVFSFHKNRKNNLKPLKRKNPFTFLNFPHFLKDSRNVLRSVNNCSVKKEIQQKHHLNVFVKLDLSNIYAPQMILQYDSNPCFNIAYHAIIKMIVHANAVSDSSQFIQCKLFIS